MGSINAVPEYQAYYNLGSSGAASTGLVFSIFQIGQMAGALFTWICDWQGRRVPIFGGCLGVVISSIITAVAPNREFHKSTLERNVALTFDSPNIHWRPIPPQFLLNNRDCCRSLVSCRDSSTLLSRNSCWK